MSILFCGDWLPAVRCGFDFGGRLAVGNLECAFSPVPPVSGKAYTSVLPVGDIANVAASPFAALSLANNHTYDAGNFDEFHAELRNSCSAIDFFGTRERPFAELCSGGRKIAVIGCMEKSRSRGARLFPEESAAVLLTDIRKNYDEVYLFPHWGKEGEYTRYPSPRQQALARRWIDGGAAGIFGHHSHVFQGREVYRNRPVYYSLGNFFFPHPESVLYEGTSAGLTVEVSEEGAQEFFHSFSAEGEFASVPDECGSELLESISSELEHWSTWSWAKKIGAFNLRKNDASWRLRLKKNFWKTLPLYAASRVMPVNLLFRFASRFGGREC